MTAITAVKKDGLVSIACDSQANYGSLKADGKYLVNSDKLFEYKGSVIGLCGWSATTQIVEHLIQRKHKNLDFSSRLSIFETMLSLHEELTGSYYIETNEESDQPVQSNQIDALVINPNGLFQIGSYREVNEYARFWAIGSGNRLALGAMHALYETKATAEEIAIAGVNAAAEFDDGCCLPAISKVIKLNC